VLAIRPAGLSRLHVLGEDLAESDLPRSYAAGRHDAQVSRLTPPDPQAAESTRPQFRGFRTERRATTSTSSILHAANAGKTAMLRAGSKTDGHRLAPPNLAPLPSGRQTGHAGALDRAPQDRGEPSALGFGSMDSSVEVRWWVAGHPQDSAFSIGNVGCRGGGGGDIQA